MAGFFEQVVVSDEINAAVIILRLFLAAVAGGLVGLEREIHTKPAGLRTYIIIAVGAALLMLLSVYIPQTFKAFERGDPGRIAAHVVTGIGFLGAGAIFRFGLTVKGLTSAASIWTTAGIGLAIGAGLYIGAAAAVILLLIALYVLELVEEKVFSGAEYKSIYILSERLPNQIKKITQVLQRHKIKVEDTSISEHIAEKQIELKSIVRFYRGLSIRKLFEEINEIDGIIKIELD